MHVVTDVAVNRQWAEMYAFGLVPVDGRLVVGELLPGVLHRTVRHIHGRLRHGRGRAGTDCFNDGNQGTRLSRGRALVPWRLNGQPPAPFPVVRLCFFR